MGRNKEWGRQVRADKAIKAAAYATKEARAAVDRMTWARIQLNADVHASKVHSICDDLKRHLEQGYWNLTRRMEQVESKLNLNKSDAFK